MTAPPEPWIMSDAARRARQDYLLPLTHCPCSRRIAIGLENGSSHTPAIQFPLAMIERCSCLIHCPSDALLHVQAEWHIWTHSGRWSLLCTLVLSDVENHVCNVCECWHKSIVSRSALLIECKQTVYPWESPDLTSELLIFNGTYSIEMSSNLQSSRGCHGGCSRGLLEIIEMYSMYNLSYSGHCSVIDLESKELAFAASNLESSLLLSDVLADCWWYSLHDYYAEYLWRDRAVDAAERVPSFGSNQCQQCLRF